MKKQVNGKKIINTSGMGGPSFTTVPVNENEKKQPVNVYTTLRAMQDTF